MTLWRSCACTVAAVGLAAARSLAGQEAPDSSGTSSVFRRYADYVVKIEVLEKGSAAKSALGSGFFVSDSGHVVTNFHVISEVINHPDRYRAEMVDRSNVRLPVTILAVDVINDVALLATGAKPAHHFDIGVDAPRVNQGDRLFALGHPRDLGLTIVEGTYNGLLQHTLYPKLHFTGSLNHGMSGGPTIAANGHVIGINVSTEGNQLSFLVPVDRARLLYRAVSASGFAPPKDFLVEVARQLRANQAVYTERMFEPGSKTVQLGHFSLPTEPAPFFRCWGDAAQRKEDPFTASTHECSTEDYVFLSSEQSSGLVEVDHLLLASTELNALRFSSLFEERFQAPKFNIMGGIEEDFTSFRCTTDNVRNGATTMRTAFCVRGYKRLPGLYDAVLKAAVLGGRNEGVVTTLTLSGVTFDNAQRLSRRYLERIAWRG